LENDHRSIFLVVINFSCMFQRCCCFLYPDCDVLHFPIKYWYDNIIHFI